MAFCSFASQFCKFGSFVGNGRSNARPVKPIGTLHDSIEIEIASIGFGYGRVCTVVNYFTWTHRRACFEIVNTYTVATTRNEIGFYTKFTKRVNSRLPYFVFGQFCYKIGIVTIVGTTYSNICFSATINYIKHIRLNKACVTRS